MLKNKDKLAGWGLVEFASANEAKKALEMKNGAVFLGGSIILKMASIYIPQPRYCFDHKVWHEDCIQRESLLKGEDDPVEGLDESGPADFSEAVLFVANLSPQTKIWHILQFFENVGKAVSVRLIVNHEGKHVGYGFVEFASAKKAKKALEKKNDEYLHDHRIFLQVVKIAPYPPQDKYNLVDMLCYEDYIRQKSLLIGDDEPVEGCVKPPNYLEAVAVRKKTLFCLHRRIRIPDIISFFKDVGEVVSVRLIVSTNCRRAGGCYVEFASANEAKKALEQKNDKILLREVSETYPPPEFCIDYKPWFEDYLRRERCALEDETVKEGLDEPPDFAEEVAARKKTIFVGNISPQTEMWQIYSIFNCVSDVVSVRLIVNDENEHVGCAYVEFASASEANKALEIKRTNKAFKGNKLYFQMAKRAPYPPRPRYSHAEMLWYEDYLRRESLTEEKFDKVSKPGVLSVFSGKKVTFSDNQ